MVKSFNGSYGSDQKKNQALFDMEMSRVEDATGFSKLYERHIECIRDKN